MLENYADGVWLVELAPVADPTLVPHMVANAAGVGYGTDQTVTGALTNALRNRHLLLVLDNCEHLLDACARIVNELVRSCAHLHVLATSREALGLTGEIAWRVPSLSVPDPHQQCTLAELADNPAVQLFVERATALQPHFALTERNAAATAQICRRLDGIPLALELAAGRIQALSPEQIAARLDQRFRLLTGGSRAALPRQQTLRSTLDWSYELLMEPERLLLNRLAVFAGGWNLEAAEVVCSDQRIKEEDVLDLLAQLVSKSLVLADEAGDGAERYRLLETVRQYARERLLAAGEAEVAHQRHADYFLAFGAPLEPELMVPSRYACPQVELLDQVEREQDNLRAALRWWIESQDAERALRLAGVLFELWFWRGSLTEGRAWLSEILSLPSAQDNPVVRRRALPLLGHMACRHADYAVALGAFEELLAAHQSVGNRLGAASTLMELANVHYLRAAYAAAWDCLNASRAQGIDLGDHLFEVMWDNYASMTALCEGRHELARKLATEAMEGFDAERQSQGGAYCQMTLGNLDLQEGNYEAAGARFLQALQVGLDFGDLTLLAHLIEGFSGLASARGQHQPALRLRGAAAAVREAAGAPLSPAWESVAARWLTISRQTLGKESAAMAFAAGRRVTMEQALEEARALTR